MNRISAKQYVASSKRKSGSDENVGNVATNSYLNSALMTKRARMSNQSNQSEISSLSSSSSSQSTNYGSGSGSKRLANGPSQRAALSNSNSSGGNRSSSRLTTLNARTGMTPGSASKSSRGQSSAQKERSCIPSEPPTSERIKLIFDEGLSIPVDKPQMVISSIQNPKKSGDFKEKQKRYEHAVKDLRDSISAVFSDLSTLKSKSIVHEANLNAQIRDYHTLITENSRKAFSLSDNENRYKAEIHRLRLENDKIDYKLSEFQFETARLHEQASENDRVIREGESKRSNEEALKADAQSRIRQMEAEILSARREAVEAGHKTRDACEERYNQALQPLREEVAELRKELSRRQYDAERGYTEQLDIDRISSQLEEQLLRIQSSIREEEGKSARNLQEIETLTSELSRAKEDIACKDAELREALSSFSSLQKQFSDENSVVKLESLNMEQKIFSIQSDIRKLQDDIKAFKEDGDNIKREILELKNSIASKEHDKLLVVNELKVVEQLKEELHSIQAERVLSEEREAVERRERVEACIMLQQAQEENEVLLRELENRLCAQIDNERTQLSILTANKDELIVQRSNNNEAMISYNSEISQLQYALSNKSTTQEREANLKSLLMEVDKTKKEYDNAVAAKEQKKSAFDHRITLFEDQIKQGELQRRKLQNTILELRGNVRVFARVRPFVSSIDSAEMVTENQDSTISINQDATHMKLSRVQNDSHDEASVDFNLDKIFGLTSSQENIYGEVRDLVQSALEGYNVCIMAYGQAASGKTHTMYGCGTELNKGIVPRALEQALLHKTEVEKSRDWTYRIQVTFFEICNETIRDLLRPGTSPDLQYEIKGDYYIPELQREVVDSLEKIEDILEHAARFRGAGHVDLSSSRGASKEEAKEGAHSVLTVHISAVNTNRGESIEGSLVFVDLIGTTPLNNSLSLSHSSNSSMTIGGASQSGDRSLESLVDVFKAVEAKQFSIPFKNSKLTHYLQPAISQNGKVLMMVNLCPMEESFEDSLNNLKFSEIVKRCELGKPKPKKSAISAPKDGHAKSATSKPASAAALPRETVNRVPTAVGSKFKVTFLP